jgi:hypothetical protein
VAHSTSVAPSASSSTSGSSVGLTLQRSMAGLITVGLVVALAL